MNIEQQLIFLFSALGGINGLLLSGYFLFKKSEKCLSDYFLGGLLLMLSIRIIKSVFLHFNRGLFESFVQIGLMACFLIGPFLLLYAISMTRPNSKIKSYWPWFIVPYLVIFSVFSYHYSYYDDRRIWQQFIELIYKQWGIHILIAGYFLRNTLLKIFRRKKLEDHEFWLVNIFIGTFIVYLAYETSNYTSYIVGALSFTFLFYILLLLWFYKRTSKNIAGDSPLKYANSTLDIKEITHFQDKLKSLIETKKPYLDPELTLQKLSQKIEISSKDLSRVINQTTGQNYSQYIATLRINESKKLLLAEDYQHLKIAAIAYESGFNSVSSFNTHFKKIVGITAKDYRKSK